MLKPSFMGAALDDRRPSIVRNDDVARRDHRDCSLLRLHRAAIAERVASPCDQTARAALAAALDEAPWGPQPDGSFVTCRRASWSGWDYVTTLHAPGKGGPLAEVRQGRLREIRTPAEARAVRDQERAARRAQAAIYEETAARAAEDVDAGTIVLQRDLCWGSPRRPGAWEAYDGQKGGVLVSPEGVTVSLPGVLRRAGVSVADDDRPLDVLLQHLLDCVRECRIRGRMPRTGRALGRRRRESLDAEAT